MANSSLESHAVRHFDYIDALRGIAILGVIGFHTGIGMTGPTGWLKGPLFWGLNGVELFFVASALTLSFSWHARAPASRYPFFTFLLRRIFRIAPGYWVAIGFYQFFVWETGAFTFPPRESVVGCLTNGLLVHAWFPQCFNNVVPGGWSIGVEFGFYLVFPFLFCRLKSVGSFALASVVCLAILGAFSARYAISPLLVRHLGEADAKNYLLMWLPAEIPVFLMGFVAWRVVTSEAVRRWRGFAPASLGFLSVSAIAFATARIFGTSAPHEIVLLFFGLGFAGLAIALHLRPWGLLICQPLRAIGRLSYALYLVHWIPIHWLVPRVEHILRSFVPSGGNGHPLGNDFVHYGCFGVLLAASLPLAWLVHVAVELPGIRLGKRVCQWLETPPVAIVA